MADFEKAVNRLLDDFEKGYAPKDNNNGAVNWGITAAFLKLIGIDADANYVRNLSRDRAKAIYQTHFWEPLELDTFEDQHQAEVLFIAAVNMPLATAVRIFQRTLAVRIDGNVGPLTIDAANRSGAGIIAPLKGALKEHYRELAAKNPALYGDDLAGWLDRVDRS